MSRNQNRAQRAFSHRQATLFASQQLSAAKDSTALQQKTAQLCSKRQHANCDNQAQATANQAQATANQAQATADCTIGGRQSMNR